jgi:predicted nucleotidyltransferase
MGGHLFNLHVNENFRDALFELHVEGAEFIIVGAFAVSFHVRPRFTGDIDVWIRPNPDNAKRVWIALARFGAPLEGVTVDDFSEPRYFYQIGVDPLRIDILTYVEGVDFQEVWNRSIPAHIADVPVRYPCLEDVLAMKLAAGRPKDKWDARALKKRLEKLRQAE